MSRHHKGPKPASLAAASPAPATAVPRSQLWGQITVLVWFLGGAFVLLVCAVTQTGPSA